jgi:hypothetical protein
MKVILTGGLGNQLFQICAALELYPGEIEMVSGIGKPRLDANGDPEIVGLKLPSRVKLVSPRKKNSKLASKVFGLNIRAHFAPRKYEKYFLKIFSFLGSAYFSIIFREIMFIRASTNVGYSRLEKLTNRDVLVGYFQSYRYLTNKSKNEIKELTPKFPTPTYLKIKNRLIGIRTLVIHVRLGDYLNEPGIGVLKRKYYESALNSVELDKVDKVLIFTDSPDKVMDYLPSLENLSVEIITNELSSVETISLMSHGNQYIISNSTFSWWAASMSASSGIAVTAPSPWFENMPSPIDLVPPVWHSVER